MKVTITRKTGRRGAEGIQVATCPALRHRHSIRGWYEDGCRCPSAVEAHEHKKRGMASYHLTHPAQWEIYRKARRAAEQLPPHERGKEVDECAAPRHRHSQVGWREDGCRCPSTVKAHDRWLEINREASRRHRAKVRQEVLSNPNIARFKLSQADRLDAEAIAQGYHLPRCSMHTRGLAVKLMLDANPLISDRQIAWRLTAAGQGRTVTTAAGEQVHEDVSPRQVQRILAALAYKQLKTPGRAGTRLDRSGRTR